MLRMCPIVEIIMVHEEVGFLMEISENCGLPIQSRSQQKKPSFKKPSFIFCQSRYFMDSSLLCHNEFTLRNKLQEAPRRV